MTEPTASAPVWTAALETAQAHRDNLRAALSDLEHALAAAATGRSQMWAAGVRSAALTLRDEFVQHIAATETGDGLFAEVMDRARLAHRIAPVRDDHVDVRHRLDDLIERTEATSEAGVESLREDGIALLGRIVRHRHLGSELVYETTYLVDIEASD